MKGGVFMENFPISEVTTAIMALISFLLGRITKRIKK
jgi:hypothetical protein